MRVVDPMAGSGTTIVAARLSGHQAVGFDTDPLALLITKAWSSDIDPERLRRIATRTLSEARHHYRSLTGKLAYPKDANEETRTFIRFWFDTTNRRQLTALSQSISRLNAGPAKNILWCAFSRMIITKGAGTSLAIDVSHSRPHRAYKIAPVKPFEKFLTTVDQILKASHFSSSQELPAATIRRGDARQIPLKDKSVDLVITSPPYLNAIDYLRGHKLSLVWMGHQVGDLRSLRSSNIGSEKFRKRLKTNKRRNVIEKLARDFSNLPTRSQAMLIQYFYDMNRVLAEISRILKYSGKAIIVVGNSTIRGTFINNSRTLTVLAKNNGLQLASARRRELEENRRYLPPPGKSRSGPQLGSRMNEEVILTFQKLSPVAKAHTS